MIEFLQELSWIVVGQIILIDIVLALVCRNLPPNLRLKGIAWETVAAIFMRGVC